MSHGRDDVSPRGPRVLSATPSVAFRVLRWARDVIPVLLGLRVRAAVSLLTLREARIIDGSGAVVRTVGPAAWPRAWLCLPVSPLSVEDVRQRNLDLVVSVLERHGIEHFVLNEGRHVRHVLGIRKADAPGVLALLVAEYADTPLYVASRHRRRTRHVLVRRLDAAKAATGGHVRIGQPVTSPCGRLTLGLEHGCDLEFWDEDVTRTLQAPRPNKVSSVIPEAQRVPAVDLIRDRAYRTLEPFARSRMYEVRFPVDVVYTWVDGADPEWRAKKERHLLMAGHGPVNGLSANTARYENRDELRYSLRSLEMYADWVRVVHVVTDGQVPSWLNTSHPRVRLVSHEEIFGDPRCLPTFNSHAIESRLHHIGGLADHYLYLNDDFFFGRPVAPETFFESNGVARFFPSRYQLDLGPSSPHEPPVMAAAKNNRALIESTFGVGVTHKLKHAPYPQRRDVVFEMEERFADEFRRTSFSRFRDPCDIAVPSSLHAHYAYCTGRAVPGHIRHMYTDSSDPLTPTRLARLLRKRNLDVFCVNDTDLAGVDADVQSRQLHRFLSAYFPVASSFERPPLPVAQRTVPQKRHEVRLGAPVGRHGDRGESQAVR